MTERKRLLDLARDYLRATATSLQELPPGIERTAVNELYRAVEAILRALEA